MDILHYIRVGGAKVIQIISRVFPIDNHIVVFYAHKRKGLCCNPKYIMLEMIKRPEKYKLYWISEYPETVPKSDDYKVVRKRSAQYYLICSRAKMHITNDIVDETLLKRKGQIYINTWHGGGAFKKAGFDIVKHKEEEKQLHIWYDKVDYMIVSSTYLADKFQSAFQLTEGQILKTGMPRSDIFFQDNTLYEAIRKQYGLDEGVKIVLYAPTYRYHTYELLKEDEIKCVLDALHERFGGEWVFFFRAHSFDKEEHYQFKDKKLYDCNDYYDAQELLCAVDVLITDYSSLLWDCSLLKKPCICYAKTPKKYANQERDFYIPYEEWPYPKSTDIKELVEVIRRFAEEKYSDKVAEFLEKLNGYEKGCSTQIVVDRIERLLGNGERE